MELKLFLECGCDVDCFLEEATDIVHSAAHRGLSGDVLLLLLSKALGPWPERRHWEPVLTGEAQSIGVEVLALALEPCSYPKVLHTFHSRRALKRWLWHRSAADKESPEWEECYRLLSDQPGRMEMPLTAARSFVFEAAMEFAQVIWVPCAGRTPVQQCATAGLALGLELRDEAEIIRARVEETLARSRVLVVFEGLTGAAPFAVHGRASALLTSDTDSPAPPPATYAAARQFVLAGRLAEAFEIFSSLPLTEDTRREMAWILNEWDRCDEANIIHPGHLHANQLSLF